MRTCTHTHTKNVRLSKLDRMWQSSLTFPAASRSPPEFWLNLVVCGNVRSEKRRQPDRKQKAHICKFKMGGYVNILTLAIFSDSCVNSNTNTGRDVESAQSNPIVARLPPRGGTKQTMAVYFWNNAEIASILIHGHFLM